jgi:hypothetical protein
VLAVQPHTAALPTDLSRVEHVGLDAALERADLHVALVGHSLFRGAAARCAGNLLDFCGAFGLAGSECNSREHDAAPDGLSIE